MTAKAALAARLRARLGVPTGPEIAPRDVRALRAAMALSKTAFAAFLGLRGVATVSRYETDGVVIRPPAAVAKKLLQALDVAREMGALTHDPGVAKPRYERPPADFEYRCSGCGKALHWNRVRKLRGEWVHASRPCGPVVPGGPIHRARVLAAQQAAAAARTEDAT